jgi:glucose/arabinose dehydrogenase
MASPGVGSDQRPGLKIHVDAQSMPAPGATPSRSNGPQTVPKPAEALPHVPAGFVVNVFADKVGSARNIVIASNGDVFLAQQHDNKVALLHDDGTGTANRITTFVDGFQQPFGIAIGTDMMLIADLQGVWRIPYHPGDTVAQAKPTRITAEGAIAGGGGHTTRNVLIAPDGTKFYVAIGSKGNAEGDPEPRATIQEFAIDGSHQRTFASGLRNPIGMAFAPGTTDLYTVVNERDGLGDELVPDYLTKVVDGGFYGWPYSYLGAHPDPKKGDQRPDLVSKALVPDLLFRSHVAPVGMVFYTGAQFPKSYQGGAFVALHGSWNAAHPRGYEVAFVPFAGGKPTGSYTVFASGFWIDGETPAKVFGRPSGVAMMKDGSLLIADDVARTVWRVSYKGD